MPPTTVQLGPMISLAYQIGRAAQAADQDITEDAVIHAVIDDIIGMAFQNNRPGAMAQLGLDPHGEYLPKPMANLAWMGVTGHYVQHADMDALKFAASELAKAWSANFGHEVEVENLDYVLVAVPQGNIMQTYQMLQVLLDPQSAFQAPQAIRHLTRQRLKDLESGVNIQSDERPALGE